MSDQTPAIFPPFGPSFSRPAPPTPPAAAPAPAPEPAPVASAAEPAAPAEPEPASFGRAETDAEPFGAEPLPWETAAFAEPATEAPAEVGFEAAADEEDGPEDLPWLELPATASPAPTGDAVDVASLAADDAPEVSAQAAYEAGDEVDGSALADDFAAEAALGFGPAAYQPAADPADDGDARGFDWMPWETPAADAEATEATAGAPSAETFEPSTTAPLDALEETPAPAASADEVDYAAEAWTVPEAEAEPEPAAASDDEGRLPWSAPTVEPESDAGAIFGADAAPADAGASWDAGQPAAAGPAEEWPVEVPAAASVASPSVSGVAADASAGAFAEVADRLESIARSLRDDPGAFLAGGARDPLSLLVTGFVLGYRARGGGGPGNG